MTASTNIAISVSAFYRVRVSLHDGFPHGVFFRRTSPRPRSIRDRRLSNDARIRPRSTAPAQPSIRTVPCSGYDIDTNESDPSISLAGQLIGLPLKSLQGLGVPADILRL